MLQLTVPLHSWEDNVTIDSNNLEENKITVKTKQSCERRQVLGHDFRAQTYQINDDIPNIETSNYQKNVLQVRKKHAHLGKTLCNLLMNLILSVYNHRGHR